MSAVPPREDLSFSLVCFESNNKRRVQGMLPDINCGRPFACAACVRRLCCWAFWMSPASFSCRSGACWRAIEATRARPAWPQPTAAPNPLRCHRPSAQGQHKQHVREFQLRSLSYERASGHRTWGKKKATARPAWPARPVRPIRWT